LTLIRGSFAMEINKPTLSDNYTIINSISKYCFALLAGFVLTSLLSPVTLKAQGNLLITPKRVVFEGSRRSMDLNLANIGNDTATYAISMVQIRMNEDGSFETITEPDPGQRFADRFIRFFPRSVTLGPNESQLVKLQLIRQGEMTPGEYRSHMYFRALPEKKPLGEEDIIKDTSSISVKLVPVFGITIPAIVRVGESNTSITITDVALDYAGDSPRLSLIFNRTGNMSVYGDLKVDHISPQGVSTRVGVANGIAIYTPNSRRKLQFSLNKVQEVDFTSGKLHITFSAPSDIKPATYAEAELIIP